MNVFKKITWSVCLMLCLALSTMACSSGGTTTDDTVDETAAADETSTDSSTSTTDDTSTDDTTDDVTTNTDTDTTSDDASDDTAEDNSDDSAADDDATDDDDDGADADGDDAEDDDAGDDDAADDGDDAGDDTDSDGVVDADDNCPLVSNADQADEDDDGTGDTCDEDDEAEDTTAPTISTIATDTGIALSSESSTLILETNTFLVTFSETIVGEVAGLATLDCEGTSQEVTVDQAPDTDAIADNEVSITPATTLPTASACTLTMASGITDSVGNATTEAIVFDLHTCGVSDDFSDANSLDICWNAGVDNEGILTSSVADSAATFSIAAASSTSGESGPKSVGYTKVVNGTDYVIESTFTSVSGLKNAFGETGADGAVLMIQGTSEEAASIICGPVGNGEAGVKILFMETATFTQFSSDAIGAGTGTTDLAVRLTREGTTFTCEFSSGGGEFAPVGGEGASITEDPFDGVESSEAGLFFIHNGDADLEAVVDGITFSSAEEPE